MKILVLTNLYPPHYVGGYELRCAAITEALRLRGHEVHVLTSNHGLQGEPPPVEPHIERSLCIHGYYGHPWLGLNSLKQLEFHNNHILRQSLAVLQPDVVHVWCMGGLSKSLCLTLQRSGVPTVYDVSDHWILRSLTGDVWLEVCFRKGLVAAHNLGGVVQLEVSEDRRDFKRMGKIGVARRALLLAVGLHGVDIGAVQQIFVGVRIVAPHAVNQIVLTHHLRIDLRGQQPSCQ